MEATTVLKPWVKTVSFVAATVMLITGCSNNSDSRPEAMAEFNLVLTNLTANQPMSPPALVLHRDSWQAFETGTAASEAVEMLAEGGNNSPFLEKASESNLVVGMASGAAPIAPGASETFSIQVPADELEDLSVSVLSMLVNTNDALAAVSGVALTPIDVQERIDLELISYDSGTEANTETVDTIPGPAGAAGGQEGFNAARDDIRNAVHVHAGVVTRDTGLASSALTEAHRWDHAVGRLVVQRIQ